MVKSNRCLYVNSFQDFCSEDNKSILGAIVDSYHGDLLTSAREAWVEEIRVLKCLLEPYKLEDGKIIFEYDIPRLGKRIDAVLLFRGIIFCLEFKVGETKILMNDVDQVLDYALDLDNFHKLSEGRIIVPILVATRYNKSTTVIQKSIYSKNVINPLCTGENDLAKVISKVLELYPNEIAIDQNWIISPYSPTPTIIEAARELYENHSVEDITRHEADKVNTDKTIDYLLRVIADSKKNNKKSICFVTGVPGAGKTLVGLEVAIRQTYQGHKEPVKDEGAVYLSGNGPLVAVLTEALAQDNVKKRKNEEIKKR